MKSDRRSKLGVNEKPLSTTTCVLANGFRFCTSMPWKLLFTLAGDFHRLLVLVQPVVAARHRHHRRRPLSRRRY